VREKIDQIDDWRTLTYRTRAICAFHTPNHESPNEYIRKLKKDWPCFIRENRGVCCEIETKKRLFREAAEKGKAQKSSKDPSKAELKADLPGATTRKKIHKKQSTTE